MKNFFSMPHKSHFLDQALLQWRVQKQKWIIFYREYGRNFSPCPPKWAATPNPPVVNFLFSAATHPPLVKKCSMTEKGVFKRRLTPPHRSSTISAATTPLRWSTFLRSSRHPLVRTFSMTERRGVFNRRLLPHPHPPVVNFLQPLQSPLWSSTFLDATTPRITMPGSATALRHTFIDQISLIFGTQITINWFSSHNDFQLHNPSDTG